MYERRNIFIDRVAPGIDAVEYLTLLPEFQNLQNTDQLSLFFGITAGYAIQPRRLYRYNIFEDSLIRSESAGIFNLKIQPVNLPNQARPFFLTHTAAHGNLREYMNIPFSDSSAWLTMYDHNLEFAFEPVPFPGFARIVYSFPVEYNHSAAILLFTFSKAQCDTCNFLSLYDLQGNLLTTNNLDFSLSSFHFSKTTLPNLSSKLLIASYSGDLYKVNKQFEFEKIIQLDKSNPVIFDPFYYSIGDKQAAWILPVLSSRTLTFFVGSHFNHLVQAQFDVLSSRKLAQTITVVKEPGKPQKIFFQGENTSYFISIIPNPLFQLQWFILIGIFAIFYGLFFLSRRLYKKQLLRNMAAKKEMLELQFQSVSNQINPHFIFNALNAINASIYIENKADAFAMGARFSALMRETVTNSEKITRSLENELEFVRNYLEIERFRFKNNFDYTISIGEGVELYMEIPKMIIQTFAENAVKHGLQPLREGGFMHIEVKMNGGTLLIIIQDNGIGRSNARPDSHSSTGKGIVIMEKLSRLYHKLYKRKIVYRIIDLDKRIHGQTGTRVEVELAIL